MEEEKQTLKSLKVRFEEAKQFSMKYLKEYKVK